MNAHADGGSSQKCKEAIVDKRHEEDVVSQIDEISRLAHNHWQPPATQRQSAIGKAKHCYGTNQTETKHNGRKHRSMVGQHHGYRQQEG